MNDIKIKVNDYLRIFDEEQEQIEQYYGKPINEVTDDEYHKYLIEIHPDEAEVIN